MNYTTHKIVLMENDYNKGWSCLICSKPLEIFQPYTGIVQAGHSPETGKFDGIYGWTCLSELCVNTWILQHI